MCVGYDHIKRGLVLMSLGWLLRLFTCAIEDLLPLMQVFLGAYKSCPLEVCTVYAVSWTMRHYLIGFLATKFDAFIEKEFGDVTKLSSGTSIFSTLLSNNSEVLQPLTDVLQKALSARYSVCGQPFIPTAQSVVSPPISHRAFHTAITEHRC